jgi:acetyltransferase-like isoleucine patch superfamily enzyme
MYMDFQKFYINRFIRPQFEYLGIEPTILQPWNLHLFSGPIYLGDFANVITTSDNKVRLSIWTDKKNINGIRIGNYCLICPGVRISAASDIKIEDNCMLASGVYITDADWHGIYNRVSPGTSAPVRLEDNVWVGDSAVICKGVTIGRNSIIGASAVVVTDIPENTVAAGNPAKPVKSLDPDKKFTTRADWFSNPEGLNREIEALDRYMLEGNTFTGWFRYLLGPRKGD